MSLYTSGEVFLSEHRSVSAFDAAASFDAFREIIDSEQNLAPEHKAEVKALYKEVRGILRKQKMDMALASLDLLIELRQKALEKDRIRRDGTSAYMHELSQAIYLIWLYENRKTVVNWVNKKRGFGEWFGAWLSTDEKPGNSYLFQTRKGLEVALTLCFNHDSGEDLGLSETAFQNRMMPYTQKFDRRMLVTLGEAFVAITKRKDLGETMSQYSNRVGLQPLSLGCKMIDRIHNLMSLVGSGRTIERMREYLDETEMLLMINKQRIAKNGTLVYLGQYLNDQIELISLYLNVKQPYPGSPVSVARFMDLDVKIDQYRERYETATINYKIHPMLGVIRRIVHDEEISTLLAARQDPERALFVPHTPGPERLKRA